MPEAELRISSGSDARCIDFPCLSYIVLEYLFPVNTIIVILHQYLLEQFFQSGWYFGIVRNDNIFVLKHFDEFGNWLALEGTLSEDHLVEHDANWPDICLHGVDFSFDDLGSHVDGGAKHGLRQLVGIFQGFAETKICDFNAAIMDEYIIRLNVPMHYVTSG